MWVWVICQISRKTLVQIISSLLGFVFVDFIINSILITEAGVKKIINALIYHYIINIIIVNFHSYFRGINFYYF